MFVESFFRAHTCFIARGEKGVVSSFRHSDWLFFLKHVSESVLRYISVASKDGRSKRHPQKSRTACRRCLARGFGFDDLLIRSTQWLSCQKVIFDIFYIFWHHKNSCRQRVEHPGLLLSFLNTPHTWSTSDIVNNTSELLTERWDIFLITDFCSFRGMFCGARNWRTNLRMTHVLAPFLLNIT